MNWFKFGIAALVLSVTVMACVDDAEELLEDDDIAELIENALNSKSGGFDSQLEDMLYLVENYQDQCGESIDSTFEKEKGIGSIATYNYTYGWEGTVNCDANDVPQDIDFSYTSTGTYTVPRMTSSDNGTYNMNVSGILPTETQYNVAGSYTRVGTQTTKIRNEFTFTATLGVALTEMLVNKATKNIDSGTATFTVEATSPGGDAVNREGDITYNGDNTATISFNGKSYDFDLD
ncbi:MAG: hypothetical protein AB8G11_09265 [Saprospiraceae bacterium]